MDSKVASVDHTCLPNELPPSPKSAKAQGLSELPRVGLSLEALRRFAAPYAGKRVPVDVDRFKPFELLTTGEVVRGLLLGTSPSSSSSRSYADLLQVRATGTYLSLTWCLAPPGPDICVLAVQHKRYERERVRFWLEACIGCASQTPRRLVLTATGLVRAQDSRDDSGRALVAPATCFVSHAWENPFADMLAALHAVPGAEEAYFWVGECRATLRDGL